VSRASPSVSSEDLARRGREHGKGPCRWKVLWATGGGRLHGWIARSSLGGGRLFSPRVPGLRTGVTAGKQASTTGVPEVTSLAGMRRSECGVVKRFILSRVERRRAQTRRGESQSLSKGAASDTPLETREMRVHVTAVTVGRHRSSSSCLRSSSRALTRSGAPAHSSRGAQAKVSARRKRGLHPGRCRHAERRRKGERVAPLIMT
jgi:hypothetical protein